MDILGIRAGYVVAEVGWGWGGGRGIRRNWKEREKERKIGKYGGRKTETNRIAKYKQKEIWRIRHNVARNPIWKVDNDPLASTPRSNPTPQYRAR